MGPPTAVPLRDVSRVMILLRSLFFNLSLPHPSGPNFWQGFKSSWRHGRSIEPCISKQDQQKEGERRETERANGTRGRAGTRRGALRGAVVMCGQVYFLASRGCLTSGFPPASMRQDSAPLPLSPSPFTASLLTSLPRRMEGSEGFSSAHLKTPSLPSATYNSSGKLPSSPRLPDSRQCEDTRALTSCRRGSVLLLFRHFSTSGRMRRSVLHLQLRFFKCHLNIT